MSEPMLQFSYQSYIVLYVKSKPKPHSLRNYKLLLLFLLFVVIAAEAVAEPSVGDNALAKMSGEKKPREQADPWSSSDLGMRLVCWPSTISPLDAH